MGVAGDVAGLWKDYFTELLIIDQLRGAHSTGAALINREYKNPQVTLIKAPGSPSEIIRTKEYRDAMNTSARCLIGHNRYATKGAHTTENAHPFDFPNVVGAHNGTLDHWCIKTLYDADKFGTDSEAIFSNINKFGLDETLKKIAGAWALVWFDKHLKTINFLRNDKRPLYYTYSKDRCTLMWASEKGMLQFVMERHNLAEENHEYFVVEPNMHFSWKVPEFISGKFDTPRRVEAKSTAFFQSQVYSRGSYSGSYGGNGNWLDEDWEEWNPNKPMGTSSNTQGNVVPFKVLIKPSELVKPPQKVFQRLDTDKFRTPYKYPNGVTFGKNIFNSLVDQGCMFCGYKDVKWGEFIHVVDGDLDGKRHFMCEECYNNDDALELSQQILVP